MVICLEHGADLHMAQLTPLPLTVSCFSKIQIGFVFPVPAHPGSPGQRAVKWVCVCVISIRGRAVCKLVMQPVSPLQELTWYMGSQCYLSSGRGQIYTG